jgi:hypothetical protein
MASNDFEKRKFLTQREAQAARRFAQIQKVLDDLAPPIEEVRFGSPADAERWEPARGRDGVQMQPSIHNGDTYLPILRSEADWDRATIEREDLFLRRYGFDWPRRYREALIRLKHERDLTDREIKLLYRAGCLKRNAHDVRFEASKWLAFAGWALIASLVPTIILVLLEIVMHAPNTVTRGLAELGAAGWLLALVWMGYTFYVKPWRILMRCGEIRCT